MVEGKLRTLELRTIWLEVTTLEDGEVLLLEVALLGLERDEVTEAEELVGELIVSVGAVGTTTVLVGSAVGVGVGIITVVKTPWVVVGAPNAEVHVTSYKNRPVISGSKEVVVEQVHTDVGQLLPRVIIEGTDMAPEAMRLEGPHVTPKEQVLETITPCSDQQVS